MAGGSGDNGWVIWEFLHSYVSCIGRDVSKSGFSWTYHPEGPTHGFSIGFKLLTGLGLVAEREILSDSVSRAFNGLVSEAPLHHFCLLRVRETPVCPASAEGYVKVRNWRVRDVTHLL